MANEARKRLGITFDATAGLKHGVGDPSVRDEFLSQLKQALTPMQTHDLGNNFSPYATHVGRVRVTTVPQPPFQAEEMGELPREVNRQGTGESGPGAAEQPSDAQAQEYCS